MRQLSFDLAPRPAARFAVATAALPATRTVVLERFLAERLGRAVRLVLTNNRSTMLSFRDAGKHLAVRAQRAFASASEREWLALARYIATNDRTAGQLLDAFIAAQGVGGERPSRPGRTRGRFFDLHEIFAELNARYFHGACSARIAWGSAGRRRYRRTIQLGCYVEAEDLIRIHPSLDQAFVPRDYLAWIIFHEMLHETLGTERRGGRRCVHPPEFSAIEQTFPGWQRCKRWEQDNLHRLLRYRPGGARPG